MIQSKMLQHQKPIVIPHNASHNDLSRAVRGLPPKKKKEAPPPPPLISARKSEIYGGK